MKRRSTIATRIMRLAPVLLQTLWGPALCVAMPHTPGQAQVSLAYTARMQNPIAAVYARLLPPTRAAFSLPRSFPCMAAPGLAFGQTMNGPAHNRSRIFSFPMPSVSRSATGTRVFDPPSTAQNSGCQASTRNSSGPNFTFTALYGVKKPWNIANQRIPRFIPAYWGRLALPPVNGEGAPNWNFDSSRPQNMANLRSPFEKAHIADRVKTAFFELVGLAEDTW